jgi:hypothetical protein
MTGKTGIALTILKSNNQTYIIRIIIVEPVFMPPKKAPAQIKELLGKLLKAKTREEKMSLVMGIKQLVKIIEQPVKKQKEKEKAEAAKKRIIKKALSQFLTALDAIGEKHREFGDRPIRERMTDAINLGFIKLQRRYKLPATFGMFSDQGNQLVRDALETFLAHPEVVAAGKKLKTPEERLNAFQDHDAKSAKGNSFFWYFGSCNSPKAFTLRTSHLKKHQ